MPDRDERGGGRGRLHHHRVRHRPRAHRARPRPGGLRDGLEVDLPLLSPVDDAGDFTDDAGALVGLNVLGDGNDECIQLLRETF